MVIPAVLVLDSDKFLLEALTPLFEKQTLRLTAVRNIEQALELVGRHDVAVLLLGDVVSEGDRLQVLDQLRQVAPYAVKLLLIEASELSRSAEVVNTGEVFRLIVRPWQDEMLQSAVKDALYRFEVVQSLREADEPTLRSLGQAIELKDPYTKGHCDRVATYSRLIGEALQLPPARLIDIKHGSWLHDCGKIGVPESILNFQGRLDHPDFEVLKMHPVWGAEVARQANLPAGVVNTILYHHERYDGLGYPKGLRGDHIPIEARIVATADVFDAITSRRPYRQTHYSFEQAVHILAAMAGAVLDPEMVDVFLTQIRKIWPQIRPEKSSGSKRIVH